MGGLCCKTRRSGTPSPVLQANTSSQLTAHLSLYEDACKKDEKLQSFDATLHERTNLQANTSSQLTAHLSSYEDACKKDEKLQSFDATLHERTNHVIKLLADGVENRSLGSSKEVADSVDIRSLGSFKEVANCLLEMNQDVVKVILESKEDIRDIPELFCLVQEYFESSVITMEFCTALGSCLERAQNSQLIIQSAINQFEEEVKMQDGAVEKKFVKTLEGLQRFKAAGDPFTPQFFALYESVHEQQESMLKNLQSGMEKLDEKLKSMETWRMVSNVLFVSAFVSVLIFSVVAAALISPPVVAALASAMTAPISSVGNWCNTLWNRYETALKEDKGLGKLTGVSTFVTINDMVNIQVLVNTLQVQIESLLHEADFAIRDEDVVILVIDQIKRTMEGFVKSIEELAAHAGKCHDNIFAARTVISDKILKIC